jgi:hypothetical protein
VRGLAVLLLLTLGCGDDREPPGRGLGRGVAPMAATAAPEETPQRRRRRPIPSPSVMEESPSVMAGERGAEEAPERDYAAELRRIAGDPSSCGELGPATADITIRLSATVTSQGVVTRGSASGPVPAEVSACLKRRIERGRFRAPVEDAPRHVSASLELAVDEPPSTTTVDDTPVFEPVGVPGRTIEGPSGQAIRGPSGNPIGGAMGVEIGGPEGTPIQGPSGIPIGAGGYGD